MYYKLYDYHNPLTQFYQLILSRVGHYPERQKSSNGKNVIIYFDQYILSSRHKNGASFEPANINSVGKSYVCDCL